VTSQVPRQTVLATVIALTAMMLAAGSARSSSGLGASGEPPTADRYIVVLKDTTADPAAVAAQHTQGYGARIERIYASALKGYAATIPTARIAALERDSRVEFVSPDGQATVQEDVLATGVSRIKAAAKQNQATGVNVAVIDTGIDVGHPDLAANIAGGRNCVGNDRTNYDDGHGHGTHVAGIVAALDNNMGVVGVAPQAKLWAVRVLNEKGSGTWSDVLCGINFVDANSPARGGRISVANMSLGGSGTDDGACGRVNHDALHKAICKAVADGVTFVVAAGNSRGDLAEFVPAAYDETIAVAALADSDGQPCGLGASTSYGYDDTFASFSNYGTVDQNHLLAAPGVSIYSTYKGGAYATFSGTSMASPHVAGAAALYLSAHPGTSPTAVYGALKVLGEPAGTNVNGECAPVVTSRKGETNASVSHTDPSLKHPESVLRADTL